MIDTLIGLNRIRCSAIATKYTRLGYWFGYDYRFIWCWTTETKKRIIRKKINIWCRKIWRKQNWYAKNIFVKAFMLYARGDSYIIEQCHRRSCINKNSKLSHTPFIIERVQHQYIIEYICQSHYYEVGWNTHSNAINHFSSVSSSFSLSLNQNPIHWLHTSPESHSYTRVYVSIGGFQFPHFIDCTANIL